MLTKKRIFNTSVVLLIISLVLGYNIARAEDNANKNLIFLPVVQLNQIRTVNIVKCENCGWWPWAEWDLVSENISCEDTTKPTYLVWVHDEMSDIYTEDADIFDQPFIFNQDGNNRCFLSTSLTWAFGSGHPGADNPTNYYFQY